MGPARGKCRAPALCLPDIRSRFLYFINPFITFSRELLPLYISGQTVLFSLPPCRHPLCLNYRYLCLCIGAMLLFFEKMVQCNKLIQEKVLEEWVSPTLLLLQEDFCLNREKYSEIYNKLYEITETLGYECAGFEIVSEDGMDIVRLYLEMPGGVDTGDCEIVSRRVEEYLDTIEGDLPERYFLEISSPGLERPLFTPNDYKRFAGSDVQIYLKKGGRKVRGVIAGVSPEGAVLVNTIDGEKCVPFEDIKKGHLVYVPQTGQKKTFKKIPKKKK